MTETRRRHAEYFVALAEAISAEGGEWEHWDERTRTEYANLRDVLGWCRTGGLDGAPAAELGMRLAKALRLYWEMQDLREGLLWLRELCGPAWRHGPAHLRARLLSQLGHYMAFSLNLDDQLQAVTVLEESVCISREIGDMWMLAEACRHCGEAACNRQDLAGAEVWFAESLTAARAAGSPWNIAWTQLNFGILAITRGDDQEAAGLYEECLPIFQRLGLAAGMGRAVNIYSFVLLRLGKFDYAAKLLGDTLAFAQTSVSLRELGEFHNSLGQVAYAQSDLRRASHHFRQALQFAREHTQQFLIARDHMFTQQLLGNFAVVAAALGHHAYATHMFCHASERFYYNKPNLVQAQIGPSLAACRAALGEEAFDAAWAAGQALTLEQAVDEALTAEALKPLRC
jgi:tetratricopeptide (TPR) repeat protein